MGSRRLAHSWVFVDPWDQTCGLWDVHKLQHLSFWFESPVNILGTRGTREQASSGYCVGLPWPVEKPLFDFWLSNTICFWLPPLWDFFSTYLPVLWNQVVWQKKSWILSSRAMGSSSQEQTAATWALHQLCWPFVQWGRDASAYPWLSLQSHVDSYFGFGKMHSSLWRRTPHIGMWSAFPLPSIL